MRTESELICGNMKILLSRLFANCIFTGEYFHSICVSLGRYTVKAYYKV